MNTLKRFWRKNFNDLSLVEMEHRYIHFDCILISCLFGIAFGVMVGPMLEYIFGTSVIEKFSVEYIIITTIAWIFAFSSLFWAWRFAAHIRRKARPHVIKWKIWYAYYRGKND